MPELATLLSESAALIARSAELCTAFRRHIAGGADPDTSLIIEILAGGATVCLECLVRKTDVPASKVADVLQRVTEIVAMTVKMARCDGCLRVTEAYQVSDHRRSTPPGPHAVSARPRPVALAEVLWRFLTEHRGEMFCSLCLAARLGMTRRLDRVLFATEGRGARRRYGRCSGCGHDRLLCGLAP
jgi:hypothetical protein